MSAPPPARHLPQSLRLAFEGLEDGITVQDTTGRLLFANELAAKMVGFESPEELIASPFAQVMDRFALFDVTGAAFDLERLPGRVVMQGGRPEPVLVRFVVRATGAERWSVVRSNALRDAHGRLEYVVNLFRDVTERRRQEEAIRVAQEWFSTTLHSIGDAVIATDRSGQVSFLNPAAEALTGWSSLEAAGLPLRRVFSIIDEKTRLPVRSPVEQVLAEDQVIDLANHAILIRKDGSERSVEDSAAPIRDASGEVVGVVLVFRDVSERRRQDLRRGFLARAVEELNSSLDYSATLATVARLAVPTIADWCAVDILEPDGVKRLAVAHVDPAKVRLVHELTHRYPPDPNATSGILHILRTGEPEIMAEIPAEVLDGQAVDEEHLALIRSLALRSYLGVPIRHGSKVIGALTLMHAESNRRYDASDLELAQALADRAAVAVEHARLFCEVEKARLQEERANRSKDEFLAMLGHELRNPLAPMVTALELMALKDGAAFPSERAVLERQVNHMVRLVDDLLDVSRIAEGKVELHKQVVDMADVMHQALEMVRPLIEQRDHRVIVEDPPGQYVEGDPVRLAQVVSNLLNNAAKYTKDGGCIQLRAQSDGATVTVCVIDNGVGMSPSMLPRVFDHFVQERQERDGSQGGLGLGLAIVRSLVELHGGTVRAESQGLGRGSKVSLTLPRCAVPVRKSKRGVAVEARIERTRSRLLLVDDNAEALELLAEAMRSVGYEVIAAADGAEALAWAETIRPDVALLDIGLPGMDGYAVGRKLRELPGLEGLPLVALTGYGQAGDHARTRAAGFAAHLVKPVSLKSLQEVLLELCPRAEPAGTS